MITSRMLSGVPFHGNAVIIDDGANACDVGIGNFINIIKTLKSPSDHKSLGQKNILVVVTITHEELADKHIC
jgi:hypothetical protein